MLAWWEEYSEDIDSAIATRRRFQTPKGRTVITGNVKVAKRAHAARDGCQATVVLFIILQKARSIDSQWGQDRAFTLVTFNAASEAALFLTVITAVSY